MPKRWKCRQMDEAQREYEEFWRRIGRAEYSLLMGRLLLSKPQGDAVAVQQAKSNSRKNYRLTEHAGAEYILRDGAARRAMRRRSSYFTRAAKLDRHSATHLWLGFAS